jgi:hypothetical protein
MCHLALFSLSLPSIQGMSSGPVIVVIAFQKPLHTFNTSKVPINII